MGFLKSLSKELYNIISCYKIQIEEEVEEEIMKDKNNNFFTCYKIEEEEEEHIYDRKIFNNYRSYVESHV